MLFYPMKQNTTIVWFRNDLRIRDNQALQQAIADSDAILPIYCIDPRQFQKTTLGFPKTGIFRANFLLESLKDLKYSLQDLGGDLIIRTGKPEEIIYALAKHHHVRSVYVQEEVCSEETNIEAALEDNLSTIEVMMEYFWGNTLYHFDDLPFDIKALPDIFTEFRKAIEKQTRIRKTLPIADRINMLEGVQSGDLPKLKDLGFQEEEIQRLSQNKKGVLTFKGGETEALIRLKNYFWEGDHLRNYKETRNGLLGANYSSKFAPWLSLGCISPTYIAEEIQKYEAERVKNKSTYWLIFELIWRDYFRFVAFKYGNKLFQAGGIKQSPYKGKMDLALFQKWANGETGVPFIDANMKELNATGFMSNRGRQNVASFLVKDLKLDWRLGAEYFESLLLDYDPCSNYGNWNYVAGIGNDPRENRYFNVLTQAKRYDADGAYVKHWIPALSKLPSRFIHEPYLLTQEEQQFIKVFIGNTYPKICLDINKWKAKSKNRYQKPKRR